MTIAGVVRASVVVSRCTAVALQGLRGNKALAPDLRRVVGVPTDFALSTSVFELQRSNDITWCGVTVPEELLSNCIKKNVTWVRVYRFKHW